MFEVGKRYRYRGGRVETCLAVNGNEAWIAPPGERGSIICWPHESWKEYVEPWVVATELFIKVGGDGTYLYTDKHVGAYPAVGKIRLTYTEGQGLAVTVIG